MENIELNLNTALDLISKEQFVEAKEILKNIIEKDNTNTEALKNLGLCEVNLDNPTEAIKAFEEVYKLNKDDTTSTFYLANCYSSTGQKEKAIEKFKEVLALRPDYIDVYKSLAMLYVEEGSIDKAIETILNGINNPNIEADYTMYYIIATSYMLKKDNKNAITYLTKAIELNQENLSLLNSLAVCYMNVQEFDKSKEILEIAYNQDPKNTLTLYNFGILYQTLKDFKTAMTYFQKSYEIEPTTTMLLTLAFCAYQAQEFPIAKMLYQNIIQAYPNNIEHRKTYVEILDNLKEYSEALENLNLILELDPKNPILLKKKGTFLRKLGLNEEAINVFGALVKRGKIDVEVYYNLAFCYVEMENFDNAKEMFKKCIILEPNNPYAHKDLGVLYLKMNCYDWAVDEIQKAIELEDDVAEFHYSLGVAYMMLSKIDEAKVALETSLKLDNKNPDALAYYGYILMLDNEYEKALAVLQMSLKIDAANFLAKTHIAKLYFKIQKYDIAKQFLLDIVSSTKDDETMNMLAVCYMQTGEIENAMGIFYKLVQKHPKNHILLTNLAHCEYKCDKKKEALEHIRQALMIFDDYQEALDLLEEING